MVVSLQPCLAKFTRFLLNNRKKHIKNDLLSERNEGLEGKAYTLHAYSKAMKRKVRFLEDNTDNRDNNSQVATSL